MSKDRIILIVDDYPLIGYGEGYGGPAGSGYGDGLLYGIMIEANGDGTGEGNFNYQSSALYQ